ncbi:MAG: MMPL family transporter [Dehalococcoidia bacterium]|nr:MMPL family transporter [Dehalococcoidia bacterium]MYD29614.1 MMPL family transporter [Dehalococcoidia bacterium]
MTDSLARICARRPWWTVALWGLAVLVGLVLVRELLGSATTTELTLTTEVEADTATNLLDTRLRPVPEPVTEVVVVQSDSLTVDDPAFREKVESVFAEIGELRPDVVATARHYYQGNDDALVSEDRSTAILPLVLTGTLEEATDNVADLVEVVEHANTSDGFRVLTVGTASIAHELNELSQEDLEQGERFGVPIALIVLVVLFGAVVAALVPLGLAVVSIAIALGIAALVGQVMDLIFFITLMITMIGLAVGIDYSLIIISRFREEMDRGLDKIQAAERAGATAGRTVLFSGLTVVVALIGMLIVPASFFQSIGLGAIIVVLVALAVTLTLLPAVLALLGSNVNRLSLPFLSRSSAGDEEHSHDGFWERVTRIVVRYPVVSIIVIAAPMLAAAYFYFEIDTGLNGVDVFPEGAQTREAFFVLEEEFSFGLVTPAEIVIDGAINSPQVKEAIAALQESIAADGRFTVLLPQQLLSGDEIAGLRALNYQILPSGLVVNPAGDLALLSVAPPGEPSARPAVEAVEDLRDRYIPAAFSGVEAEVYVGGRTALTIDIFGVVETYTPIVFAFVLGISFLILMLVFRSIVIPIKAIIMNLLSVGAAYGLLVLVFQKSGGIFGFQHAEAIDVWIPLFLFSILFGLSMDYHVFLLSRIRERYDETGDNAGAVAYGLRSTAGLITGAALIMVVVFGAFASGKTIINQQVGFGLAVAIFLDATLVRSVLVPASMELLGGRNWYLPSWLTWLPDLRIEAEESPAEGSAGK